LTSRRERAPNADVPDQPVDRNGSAPSRIVRLVEAIDDDDNGGCPESSPAFDTTSLPVDACPACGGTRASMARRPTRWLGRLGGSRVGK
jgi:hypothetical protein